MYFYQLMLAKDWQKLEGDYQLSNQQSDYYSPKPKRIKYFYDNEYHDIVKQLVNDPESCKNFYPVLQQVGLPYQTYYHKSADKVANVLTTALYIHIKGESPLLFDPNGGFKRNRRGNAEFMYEQDIPFTLKEFIKYHSDDGDHITQRPITLTKEQAKNIENEIFYGSFGNIINLYCAEAVSRVLSIYGINEEYILPLELDKAVKKIEMRK